MANMLEDKICAGLLEISNCILYALQNQDSKRLDEALAKLSNVILEQSKDGVSFDLNISFLLLESSISNNHIDVKRLLDAKYYIDTAFNRRCNEFGN